ncbi:MAG: hypothetical protein ABIZ91_19925 [Gemmatimonadaceae bacterium]
MRPSTALRTLSLTLFGAIGGACTTDSPLASGVDAADFRPMQVIVDPAVSVDVLQRLTPITGNVTVSMTLGQLGGQIKLPEAGLSVEVPEGAFNSRTLTITVTALAGTNVAYEFEPHGIVFQKPLRVTQSLKGTNLYKLASTAGVEAAYYADPMQVVTGKAKVNEFRPSRVDVTNSKLEYTVGHFSGYLVSSGRQ